MLQRAIDFILATEKSNDSSTVFSENSKNVNKIFAKSAPNTNRDFKDEKLRRCNFCDRPHQFKKELCPAFGAKCSKCGRLNHFASRCGKFLPQKPYKPNRSPDSNRNVHHVADDTEEFSEINNVYSKTNRSKQIKCKMGIANKLVDFQIDSGSSISILPIRFVTDKNKIYATSNVLKTWNNGLYKPIGEVKEIIFNPKNGKKYFGKFTVCKDDYLPILGLTACEKMNLLVVNNDNFERVNTVSLDSFNDVFSDEIGTLKGEYKLKVKEGAQPCLMGSRRTPIKQRDEIMTEIYNMVKKGILEEVREPSEWISQLVVAKKASGQIRICLDPRELNKVLIRERFQLRILDEILYEMAESKIFSKFDLSNGYFHVKLDKDSRKLTTFETPNGLFRYKRLPFGLCVAAEVFQKKLCQAITGLKGVLCIADDIIVHGKNKDEHDANLNDFLKRCRETGIRLNKEKTILNTDRVKFMGHSISNKGVEVDPDKVEAIRNFPVPHNVSRVF